MLDAIKKVLAERMLKAELDHPLEGEVAESAGSGKARNHPNGSSKKPGLTDEGPLDLGIPRDRQATFEPQLVAKYRRRLPGFDAKIISMSARGMSTREIGEHLLEIYGTEVSPQLISRGHRCGSMRPQGPPRGPHRGLCADPGPRSRSQVQIQVQVQTCILHLIRHYLDFASWKERKPVAAALEAIYRAPDAETAKARLEVFDAGPWGPEVPGHRRVLAA